MPPKPTHESLDAWKIAIDFAVEIYRLTDKLPATERYGVTQQLRRAAVSISSNVAEGTGRRTRRDMTYFLVISRGSLRETESLMYLCERLGFVSAADLANARELAERAGRLLSGLRKSLAA